MLSLEASNAQLHQQLVAADQGLSRALSCTESSVRALVDAEQSLRSFKASRRRHRQDCPGPRQDTSPSSLECDFSCVSPRSVRHVRSLFKCRPVDSWLIGVRFVEFTSSEHHDLLATCVSDIRTIARALLNTFKFFSRKNFRIGGPPQ